MMLTVNEAQQKTCCNGFVSVGDTVKGINCIGADCLAWRFMPAGGDYAKPKEDCDRCNGTGIDKEYEDECDCFERLGFCGIAGKPEIR